MPEHEAPDGTPKPRTFSFNLSFGKKPPQDERDPALSDPAAALPGDLDATPDTHRFKFEFDNRSRTADSGSLADPAPAGETADPERQREAEMWDRLGRIAEGKGAFPDTARWRARLSMFIWVIVIALPVAALIAGIASGESQQTIAVMTFGAALVGMMLRTSIR